MNRFLPFVLALFFSGQMSASHLLGGEFYYTHLGANNYEITLILYGDWGGATVAPASIINVNGHQSITSLTAPLDTSYNAAGCSGAMKVYIYKITTNLGTIPTSGLTFSTEHCCRNGPADNLLFSQTSAMNFSCTMYPDPGSNQASSSPRKLGNTNIVGYANASQLLSTLFFDPDPQDSVYVELINAKGSNGINLNYSPGYSASSPFGNGVNYTLDSKTGLITSQ
jgi:hypothetical protein